MGTVKHSFTSLVADGGDLTLVRPSNWNDDHDITLTASDVGAEAAGTVATHASASDPHTGYMLESLFDAAGDLIRASADNTPAKLTKGATGTFLQAGASDIGYADVFIPVIFAHKGTVVTTTEAECPPFYNDSGRTLTIDSVRASVRTAPTGATLICDVCVGGTTIYTSGPGTNRPAIAISGLTDQGGTPDTATLANGGILTTFVAQIGSTVAGADLSIVVWLKG